MALHVSFLERHLAGGSNSLGLLVLGPAVSNVQHKPGDIDLHGARPNTALTHGAHPCPFGAENLIVQPQAAIRSSFRGSISAKPGRRTSGRTGSAGEALIQVAPLGQYLHDLLLESAGFTRFQFDNTG